jgi:hypothetical protein
MESSVTWFWYDTVYQVHVPVRVRYPENTTGGVVLLKLRECVGSVIVGSLLIRGNSVVVAYACKCYKNRNNSSIVDMGLLLFLK